MKRILALVLAAACLLPAAGCGGTGGGTPKEDVILEAYLISKGEYPETVPYPDETQFVNAAGEVDRDAFYDAWELWWQDKRQRTGLSPEDMEGLKTFFRRSTAEFLGAAGGENALCSPVNIYLALAMLAELTDGNSRQEILTLLGADDLESLRTQAGAIWNACYCDDGTVTSIPAASLWLNQDIAFVPGTLDTLAQYYHACSYQGEMGTEDFTKALHRWLGEQTGGRLNETLSNVELTPETVLTLAATLYFRGKWAAEFDPARTEKGLFHLIVSDGESVECDFMHQSDYRNYYWGDGFSAVEQRVENGGGMWLILPDAGVSVEELLAGTEVAELLFSAGNWEQSRYLKVNLSLPKFDVTSQTNLLPGLQALGVHDVFDLEESDFSPMTAQPRPVAVTQVLHGVRVTIDEEGCEAAAYTVMPVCGAAMPPEEEVDFVLDRPFLFVITGASGLPLFAGVVRCPV